MAAWQRAVEAAGGGEDEGVRAEWRPGQRSRGGTGPGSGWRTSTAAALAGALGSDVDGGGARGRWARAVGGAGDGGGTRRR